MKHVFLPGANHDMDQAAGFYDRQKRSLGQAFLEDIQSTLSRIKNHPTAWKPNIASCRVCNAKRFPYQVIYRVASELIVIVAIMHTSRKPEYWSTRLTTQS